MAERRAASRGDPRSGPGDAYEALAIARLRLMIAHGERRRAHCDFAEAIRRIETGAARASPSIMGVGFSNA